MKKIKIITQPHAIDLKPIIDAKKKNIIHICKTLIRSDGLGDFKDQILAVELVFHTDAIAMNVENARYVCVLAEDEIYDANTQEAAGARNVDEYYDHIKRIEEVLMRRSISGGIVSQT